MKKSTYIQRDLFGPPEKTRRGWTELDRIRRRYSVLEKKILAGDFKSFEMEEFHNLSAQIIVREREAREAWLKSFGK